MRLFTSGSAPLLVETFKDFEAVSGHKILERYGMSETGMNCSNPLNGDRKPGTVGPALPGVRVRVVDSEGQTTALGEVGNLQVQGENVFNGYWRMPDKTKEDFTEDGYFNTGDQATMDEDGYVSIVGRSKDMIISGGLNVYPKEVEDVLNKMDGVSESAVVGVPHSDLGEAVIAIVVLNSDNSLTAEQIIQYAKEKLANFKVPKHVRFIDSLPRNTMSKVQKKTLREEMRSLFKDEKAL
jgi:malonyl-CoA/methylmalonyl-CoA synthetase